MPDDADDEKATEPTPEMTPQAAPAAACRAKAPTGVLEECLVSEYRRCCAVFRVRKPNSAVVLQLQGALPEAVEAAGQQHQEQQQQRSSQQQRSPSSPSSPLRAGQVTSLTLERAAAGNRGILAVCLLAKKHLHHLRVLSLRDCALYAGDASPTAITGDEAMRGICELLSGHPELDTLDLSGIALGPAAYLQLVCLVRATPSLRSLVLHDTGLREHERAHLATLLQRTTRFPPPPPATSPRHAPADDRTHSVVFAGALAQAPLSPRAAARRRQQERDEAHAQAMALREHRKNDGLQRQLRALWTATPLSCAYRCEAFPTEPAPRGWPPALANLPPSLQLGPTLEEQDELARVERRREELARDLDHVVRCMQRAVFADGELVSEAGDSAEWVSLIAAGGTVTLHAAPATAAAGDAGGDAGGRCVATLRPGAAFGEDELLADAAAGGWVRRRTAVARVAANEAQRVKIAFNGVVQPVVILWQLRRELFVKYMARHVAQHRRVWRKFIDATPTLLGVAAETRVLLSDLFEPWRIDEAEVDVLPPAPASDALQTHVVFVIEGELSIRRASQQVSGLSRGEMFLLKHSAPMESGELRLVSATSPVVVCVVPLAQLALLPEEIEAHLTRQAKGYEPPPPPPPPLRSRTLAGL